MPNEINLEQTIRNLLEQSQTQPDPAATVYEALQLEGHKVSLEYVREVLQGFQGGDAA